MAQCSFDAEMAAYGEIPLQGGASPQMPRDEAQSAWDFSGASANDGHDYPAIPRVGSTCSLQLSLLAYMVHYFLLLALVPQSRE